jgi:hypothetical protein
MSWTDAARGCLEVYDRAIGAMSNGHAPPHSRTRTTDRHSRKGSSRSAGQLRGA